MGIASANRLRRSFVTAVLFSLGVHCCHVNGQPLIYNTNQYTPSGVISLVTISQWVAVPFLTGSSAALLSSVTLYESTANPPPGSFYLSVYGDNSGSPGSVLAGGALNGPSHPNSGFITYSAEGALTLVPNTTYWVVASSDTPRTSDGLNTYSWRKSNTTNYVSSVGWSYPNSHSLSTDQGSNWLTLPSDSGGVNTYLLAIDGAIIPEPSALAFVCLAFVAVSRLQRSRQAQLPSR